MSPHPCQIVFSECFADFGQPISHLGIVGCPVGLEVCFGEFLFEFFGRLVLGHFLFVLVGLSESLPGLCELVSAGGVVRVLVEESLEWFDDGGGLL